MIGLLDVRVGFVVLCLCAAAACVWKYQRVTAAFREFFGPGPAINLGLLRATIFAMVLLNIPEAQATWYSSLDAAFLKVPHGWGWLSQFLPLSPTLVRFMELGLYVSSFLAMIGLFSRVTCAVAAVLSVVVLGLNNFYFKIGHGMHVPV